MPIYLAKLKSNKNDYRFDKFLELFKKLNIIKDLDKVKNNGLMISFMRLKELLNC